MKSWSWGLVVAGELPTGNASLDKTGAQNVVDPAKKLEKARGATALQLGQGVWTDQNVRRTVRTWPIGM
jgi:hypothetical protein